MKRKDIQELQAKPEAELRKFVADGKERLRVLRFDLAEGKVKNIAELHALRKAIARAMTFLNQAAQGKKDKQ